MQNYKVIQSQVVLHLKKTKDNHTYYNSAVPPRSILFKSLTLMSKFLSTVA